MNAHSSLASRAAAPARRHHRTAARLTLALTLAAFVFVAAGCTHRIADLTVVSSKNVDLYPLDLRGVTPQRNVLGKDGRWWFFFLPFGKAPNIEEALEDALHRGGGDIMTSAVLYRRQWTFFFIVSRQEYRVQGDVYNSGHARGPSRRSDSRYDFDDGYDDRRRRY